MSCYRCGLEESDYCTCDLYRFIDEMDRRLEQLEIRMTKMEEHKISDNMQKFFERLERIKAYTKENWENTGNIHLGYIYNELHNIFKVKEGTKSENDDI